MYTVLRSSNRAGSSVCSGLTFSSPSIPWGRKTKPTCPIASGATSAKVEPESASGADSLEGGIARPPLGETVPNFHHPIPRPTPPRLRPATHRHSALQRHRPPRPCPPPPLRRQRLPLRRPPRPLLPEPPRAAS